MLKPKVSILITSCNDEAFIEETLNSVFNQTFAKKDVEILIAHDYSKDKSGDVIQKWIDTNQQFYRHTIKFTEHKNPDGTGPTGCPARLRNAMIDQSQGDIIIPLDGDDVWHRDKVARQVKVLSKGAIFCATGYDWMTEDGQKLNITMQLRSGFYGHKKLMERPVLINSAIAWNQKKAKLKYNEGKEYAGWEDQELCARYLAEKQGRRRCRGNQVYCIRDPLMKYRVLPKSTSGRYSLEMRPIGTEDNHEKMTASYNKAQQKKLFKEGSGFLRGRSSNWHDVKRKVTGAQPA